MRRRLWLSVAMAALGAALLVAAGFASPASSGTAAAKAKRGGTLKLNMSATDVDFSDPSLAYGVQSWQIEYSTRCSSCYNYPDARAPLGSQIRPEAATGFPQGHEQRQDLHHPRSGAGLRLSNGAKVTAANFAKAINRTLSPTMQAPGATFIQNIVGAQKVHRRARPARPPASSPRATS